MYALCCLLILRFIVENSSRCFTPFEIRKKNAYNCIEFCFMVLAQGKQCNGASRLDKVICIKV